ncbi:hypothetical protein V1514DRAFT_334772 [Lipomyces japonicus]|uniref:mitochondrial 37S ribosomal protein bS18m n=1 Tax=Lipomyces japonicus TaxID=56871 RepID=UPI0034CD8E2A
MSLFVVQRTILAPAILPSALSTRVFTTCFNARQEHDGRSRSLGVMASLAKRNVVEEQGGTRVNNVSWQATQSPEPNSRPQIKRETHQFKQDATSATLQLLSAVKKSASSRPNNEFVKTNRFRRDFSAELGVRTAVIDKALLVPKFGEIISPSDLKFKPLRNRMDKAKFSIDGVVIDKFKYLELDPMDKVIDPSFLSSFIRSSGEIRPAQTSNLHPRIQKKMTRAIKRARALGLLSSVHRSADHLIARPYEYDAVSYN